jgi:hypothetical protein
MDRFLLGFAVGYCTLMIVGDISSTIIKIIVKLIKLGA